MLFNSWEFLFLLLATFTLYYGLPGGGRVWQVGLLLVSSAVFYAWEEPRLLFLLGASCILNAVAVERITFWKSGGPAPAPGNERSDEARAVRLAGRWLRWTVAANLGLLAFFKYAGFLASLAPDGWITSEWLRWLGGIPLPVGISFYTFQGISLVVDVWRGDISEHTQRMLSGRGRGRVRSVRDASFYISFFPQLVAGPIVKAHEFVDQIGGKRFAEIDWQLVRRGLIVGYFLKIFVADNLAEQTAMLTNAGEILAERSAFNTLSLLYAYGFQIFADFAGYSLIAIGLGALFGYRLPENFRFPYLSVSVTEFWRRWHISLSSWLRDYLYIPLGGNRKGKGRTYFNLFLVMFLGGLWHGAEWKFAIWGTLHGCFLAAERFLTRRRGKLGEPSPKAGIITGTRSFLGWFYTFHAVTFLWLTFMMPDLASIVAFFKSLVNGKTGISGGPAFSLVFYGSVVVLYHAWGWLAERRRALAARASVLPVEAVVHGMMVFLVLTNPGAPRGFIYFQF